MAKGNYQDDEFLVAFGQRLRFIRKQKGMTIADLAHATGSPTSTIGRVERAEMNASIKLVKQLADGLEVEVEYLFISK